MKTTQMLYKFYVDNQIQQCTLLIAKYHNMVSHFHHHRYTFRNYILWGIKSLGFKLLLYWCVSCDPSIQY